MVREDSVQIWKAESEKVLTGGRIKLSGNFFSCKFLSCIRVAVKVISGLADQRSCPHSVTWWVGLLDLFNCFIGFYCYLMTQLAAFNLLFWCLINYKYISYGDSLHSLTLSCLFSVLSSTQLVIMCSGVKYMCPLLSK